jgi:hypothetical protein
MSLIVHGGSYVSIGDDYSAHLSTSLPHQPVTEMDAFTPIVDLCEVQDWAAEREYQRLTVAQPGELSLFVDHVGLFANVCHETLVDRLDPLSLPACAALGRRLERSPLGRRMARHTPICRGCSAKVAFAEFETGDYGRHIAVTVFFGRSKMPNTRGLRIPEGK